MGTQEDLKVAFAGESQANRMYTAFAKKAEQDGFPQVAKLFRAAAHAETVHALAHFRVMKGVKSTAENVQAAIDGEGYEFRQMYPGFIETAKKEGNKPAESSFAYACWVEQVHHGLYGDALKNVQAGRDLPAKKLYVCEVCGNTVENEPPDRCPNCGAKREMFTEIR